MTLGSYLKKMRVEKCLTQKELSSKLGVSVISVCYYETNYRKPGLRTLKKYADLFEVDSAKLVEMKYEN